MPKGKRTHSEEKKSPRGGAKRAPSKARRERSRNRSESEETKREDRARSEDSERRPPWEKTLRERSPEKARSRKASRSRPASRSRSRPGSRFQSRPASRQGRESGRASTHPSRPGSSARRETFYQDTAGATSGVHMSFFGGHDDPGHHQRAKEHRLSEASKEALRKSREEKVSPEKSKLSRDPRTRPREEPKPEVGIEAKLVADAGPDASANGHLHGGDPQEDRRRQELHPRKSRR